MEFLTDLLGGFPLLLVSGMRGIMNISNALKYVSSCVSQYLVNINLIQFSLIHRNHCLTQPVFSGTYFESTDNSYGILAANECSDFIALLYFTASSAIVLSKHLKAESHLTVSDTYFPKPVSKLQIYISKPAISVCVVQYSSQEWCYPTTLR